MVVNDCCKQTDDDCRRNMIGVLGQLQTNYVVHATLCYVIGLSGLSSGCIYPLPVFPDWPYTLDDVLVLPDSGNASVTVETLQERQIVGRYIVGQESRYTLNEQEGNTTLDVAQGLCLSSEEQIVVMVPLFNSLCILPQQTTFITSFSTTLLTALSHNASEITSKDLLVYPYKANTTLTQCYFGQATVENIFPNLTEHSTEISGEMNCNQRKLNGIEGFVINDVSDESRFDISTNYPVSVLFQHSNWFRPVSFKAIHNPPEVEGTQPISSGHLGTKMVVVHNNGEAFESLSFTARQTGHFILFRDHLTEEFDLTENDTVRLKIESHSHLYFSSSYTFGISVEDQKFIESYECFVPNDLHNVLSKQTENNVNEAYQTNKLFVQTNLLFYSSKDEFFIILCQNLTDNTLKVQSLYTMNHIAIAPTIVTTSGKENWTLSSFKSPLKDVYKLQPGCRVSRSCAMIKHNFELTENVNIPAYSSNILNSVLQKRSQKNEQPTDMVPSSTKNKHTDSRTLASLHVFNLSFNSSATITSAFNANDTEKVRNVTDVGKYNAPQVVFENRTDIFNHTHFYENLTTLSNNQIVSSNSDTKSATSLVELISNTSSNGHESTDKLNLNKYATTQGIKSNMRKTTSKLLSTRPNSDFVAVVNLVHSDEKGIYKQILKDWQSRGRNPPYLHDTMDSGGDLDGLPDGKSLMAIIVSLVSAFIAVILVIVIFFLIEFFSRRKQIRNTRIRPFVSYY